MTLYCCRKRWFMKFRGAELCVLRFIENLIWNEKPKLIEWFILYHTFWDFLAQLRDCRVSIYTHRMITALKCHLYLVKVPVLVHAVTEKNAGANRNVTQMVGSPAEMLIQYIFHRGNTWHLLCSWVIEDIAGFLRYSLSFLG